MAESLGGGIGVLVISEIVVGVDIAAEPIVVLVSEELAPVMRIVIGWPDV